MQEEDLEFFVRRMREEEEAAGKADDPAVRETHGELALRYRAIVDAYRSGQRPPSGAETSS